MSIFYFIRINLINSVISSLRDKLTYQDFKTGYFKV